MSDKRPLQHNPDPLKITVATHRCTKCRQFAPRCTCWNGPDYQPISPEPKVN